MARCALRDQTKWYTIDFAALHERERVYRAARAAIPPPRPVAAAPPAGVAAAALPPLPDSHLLIDEPPLVIVADLAVAVGLDEALLLQQIRYWLADERKPPVREGRRWVCPRAVDLFAPLAFRSAKTIARALRALEERGLLLASARFNPTPGDRTKWYTIDFARVLALRPALPPAHLPRGQNASIERDNLPDSVRPFSPVPGTQDAHPETPSLPASNRPECQGQAPILPASLTESEINDETNNETAVQNEQQQHVSPGPGVVVAATVDADPLAEALVSRGLTPAVATRLRLAHSAVAVAHQLAIFDWLRATAPNDPRLTPGRLRRQIEENWATPPGFVTPADREAREASEREAREHAAQARAAVAAQDADAISDRQSGLDALGLTAADQILWTRIAQQAPALPPPFRDALFHAPRGDTPAAVIFRERVAWARAGGAAHAQTRAQVAARAAALCHRPGVVVHYLLYDDVLRLLATQEAAPA